MTLATPYPQYRNDPSNNDDKEGIKLRINDQAVRTLFDLASRGLRFLSECSATLMELVGVVSLYFPSHYSTVS